MKDNKKVFSSLISFLLAGIVAASGSASAFAAGNTANNNISINLSESKDISENKTEGEEEPFNVFDIFDAHLSALATTTTTTASTTKKTTTTTKKASTTTKATTKASATTTKKTSTTTKKAATTTTTSKKTTTTTSTTAPPLKVNRKGIDVSQWQGEIDWKKVKASGVEFAIIRAGYGNLLSQKDPMFEINMKNAQAEGIKCGTYWYSYADSVADAKKEAETCYQVIKNYSFTYPVYFDIEDHSQDHLTPAEISAITDTFCTTLQSKGYYVGVYSYANLLSTRIFKSVLDKYDVWVAHFDVSKPDYASAYGMWQYSDKGNINGITEKVDLDYAYLNYPYIIHPETYFQTLTTTNSSAKTTTTTKTTAKTTSKTTTKSTTKTTTKTTTKATTTTASKTTTTTATTKKIVAKGIDVSEKQGTINWKNVKASGIDFAIIRAGYGKKSSQIDSKFKTNITSAKSAGIDCGAYWYSNAITVSDALEEAKACYEVIKSYKFEYPIYYTIEDKTQENLSKSQLTAIAETFCSYLESKGYYVALGGKVSWLNNKYDPYIYEKFDVWVYHGNTSAPAYKGFYGMWKYTNQKTVSGISGTVSGDYCFDYFPYIMKSAHLNGY